MSEIEKIKARLLQPKPKRSEVLGLSTGSTLLNLACSGKLDVGFLAGHYYLLVGDSASGKTFLSMTCLAEATINPAFDEHRLIYDNSEDGALMDVERFFGERLAKRLEPPGEGYSSTIEEFYFHVDDAIEKGKPFIYVLDSMDALSSEEEESKFKEKKSAHRKGREVAGSYGDNKAKKNSAGLRRLIPHLRETGSILIIVVQTRDNLGFGFEKKTRSGGRALRFYATTELWSSVKGKIKKTVKDQPRQVGIQCLVEVKKNRITGQEHKVTIPIYHSLGFDDMGSCCAWLVDEGRWAKSGGSITATDLNLKATEEKLIAKIQGEGLEDKVKEAVYWTWKEIQDGCKVARKNKYTVGSSTDS